MRPLSLTVVAVAALGLALTAGPALAVPTVTIDPPKLPRGADTAVPHLEGRTVVDGSVRVPVDAAVVLLLGKSGTGYVVGVADRPSSRGTILRVEANGAVRTLGRADPYALILSADGTTVISPRSRFKADTTKMKVRDAVTGAKLAATTFDGYPVPLDAQGTDVLVSGFDRHGTQVWDTTTGTVTRLTKRIGTRADYAHDLLASYSKDPYDGGCTVISRISDPSAQLYKNCDEAVAAFSTDGSHVATVDILTDGIGPGAVTVRTVTGTRTGSYRTPRIGYFGLISFDGPASVLLETNGRRKAATVRCTDATCERASDLTRAELPRTAA